jgi:hypothetical protein
VPVVVVVTSDIAEAIAEDDIDPMKMRPINLTNPKSNAGFGEHGEKREECFGVRERARYPLMIPNKILTPFHSTCWKDFFKLYPEMPL